jgi:hypothetical protein
MKFKSKACALLLCAVAISGCGTADSPRAEGPDNDDPAATEEQTGSINLDLSLGDGDFARFSQFGYHVRSTRFDKTGTIDVSNSTTVSALVDSIPFGSGYTVTLQGRSVGEPILTCNGSSQFDVTSADIQPVTVPLACRKGEAAPEPVPVPWFATLALCAAFLGLGMVLLPGNKKGFSS